MAPGERSNPSDRKSGDWPDLPLAERFGLTVRVVKTRMAAAAFMVKAIGGSTD
jgi:hypothetical protein